MGDGPRGHLIIVYLLELRHNKHRGPVYEWRRGWIPTATEESIAVCSALCLRTGKAHGSTDLTNPKAGEVQVIGWRVSVKTAIGSEARRTRPEKDIAGIRRLG